MSAGDGDYIRKIEELLRASTQLADYDSRIELYQEAIRLADLHGDIEIGYRLRRDLIDLASHGLKYDVYGVTFAWCFAQAQRDPDRFRPQDLLYHYQHVIGKLVNFPQFQRDKYEDLFADVVKHLRAHGYSPRTVMIERRSVAIDFGDLKMAEAADLEWRKHPRDAMSAGLGFEAGRQIEYDHSRLADDAAVADVEKWFATARREDWCDDWLASEAILPLFRLGRIAEAMTYHNRYWKTIRTGTGYQWFWGPHLSFLGLTDNIERGVRVFQTMLLAAFEQPDLMSRFHFLEHALVLFRRVAQVREKPIRLRVPTSATLHDPSNRHRPSAVLAWIEETATDIAKQFDARNGNDYYMRLLQYRREMEQFARPFPIVK